MLIPAQALTTGTAEGPILLLGEPLSLWGGLDLHDATIVDRTHPQCGLAIAGRIVAMRAARGSSSSSSALVEIARAGLGPAAIVLTQYDPILAMGALVAEDLYGAAIPIVVIEASSWPLLTDGVTMRIDATGAPPQVELGTT
jgi:predicted aconitase with swiveling domain